tara:strand:- start:853 stop:2082 length:1230 start_codon:yes stop_codon:yes gene_type:complete
MLEELTYKSNISNKNYAVDLNLIKSFKDYLQDSYELCPIDSGPYAHVYDERKKIANFERRELVKIKGNGNEIVLKDGEGYITQKHRVEGGNPKEDDLYNDIRNNGYSLTYLPPVVVRMPDGYKHLGTGNGRIGSLKRLDVKDIICDVYDLSQLDENKAKYRFRKLGQVTNRPKEINTPFSMQDLASTLHEGYCLGEIEGDLTKNYDTLQENLRKELVECVGDSPMKPSHFEKIITITLDKIKQNSTDTIQPKNWSVESNRINWLKTQGYKDTKFKKYITMSAGLGAKLFIDSGKKYIEERKKLNKDGHKLVINIIIHSGMLENDKIDRQVNNRNKLYKNLVKRFEESKKVAKVYYESDSKIELSDKKIKLIGGMPCFRHNKEGNNLITVEQIKKLKTNDKKKTNAVLPI